MEQNLTRREARENAFLAAFSATFHPDDPQPVLLNQPESHEHPLDEFSLRILRDMEAHSEEIDDVIRANLKGWTIARVPRVSLVARMTMTSPCRFFRNAYLTPLSLMEPILPLAS